MTESMKKIFSFNKFFISFCAFFILVWIALQAVSYMRFTDMAKVDGERILAWQWPDKNAKSLIKICETKILKKDHNEAIVKILATQLIEPISPNSLFLPALDRARPGVIGQPNEVDSKSAVTLTYYRTNNQWFLGRVECE